MANRKKTELSIYDSFNDLENILSKDYGGDILLISNKQNIKDINPYLNKTKNIKFLESKFIYDSNFNDYIFETYGLIIAYLNDKDSIILANKVKSLDISIIFVCRDINNFEFLNSEPCAIICDKNCINIEELYLFNLKLNFLKFMNYFEEILKDNHINYLKIQNINFKQDYKLLLNNMIKSYILEKSNSLFDNLIKYEKIESLFFLSIWINFAYIYVQKSNLNQSIELFLLANINSIKRDFDLIISKYKNEFETIKLKYKKTYLMKYFFELIKSTRLGKLFSIEE